MNYKKVVSRCISSLTAVTAFLYCFKVPVYADTNYFLNPDDYTIQTFTTLGWKQDTFQDIQTVTNSVSFSGTIAENGGFTITGNNFTGVESGQLSVQIGDSYGVANDIISGTIGSTSQQLICNPNPLSEYIGDDTVAYPKYSCYYYAQNYGTQQDINLTNIVLDGVVNGNRTTTYSGSLNGTNLDFTLNNLTGTVTGTIKSDINITLPWMVPDAFNSKYVKINNNGQDQYNPICVLMYVHFNSHGPTVNNLKKLIYCGTSTANTTSMDLYYPNVEYIVNRTFNGLLLYVKQTTSSTNYLRFNNTLAFDGSDFKIIPIFIGNYNNMTDDIKAISGIDSILTNLTPKVNELSTEELNLDYQVDLLDDIEQSQFYIRNQHYINPNNYIISSNGFLNASSWLATQYTNLVNPTPISNMVMFSLTLGLAMVIIGKVRR